MHGLEQKKSESERDYNFPLFFTSRYECDIKYEYFENFRQFQY